MSINIKRDIDWESGNAKLNDVLFDVEKVPLYAEIKKVESINLLDTKPIIEKVYANGYQALINTETKDVLGVVSSNYHLITNKEALKKGKEIFNEIFSIKLEELTVLKVISSKNKTYCHIDLVHPAVNFNVWVQDCWYPFLRITNSYNRTFALSYELGFVRKLCSNGVVFDKQTVVIKINHSRGMDQLLIKTDLSKFKEAKASFINKMLSLRKFNIPKVKHFPLVCKCLGITKPVPNAMGEYDERIVDQFSRLKDVSIELSNLYVNAEGETAYSLFNVITDLVSHQEEYNNIPYYHLRPSSYSFKPTLWIEEFVSEIEKRSFDLENYIGEYKNY